MQHLLDVLWTDFEPWLVQRQFDTYRMRQVRQWLFAKRAGQFEEMTDLPLGLRRELSDSFRIWSSKVIKHGRSPDGTEKLLLQLHDGRQIECVLIQEESRRTICISTQVGCAMGCVFCASGLDGVERNLTSGEIVEQMLLLQRLLPPDERLTHIVVMGMGEPLANLDRLMAALEQATQKDGLGISARRITISTVGLPSAMERLSESGCHYHLAVSLHAPTDKLRDRLVPVNKRTGLTAILDAADRYFDTSGRRLTFEYVLLSGVNDQSEHARQLAKLLRGRPALINLIPYNPVAGLPYRTPPPGSVRAFREVLECANLTVKIRKRKGDTINAACGQLRRITPRVQGHDHGK